MYVCAIIDLIDLFLQVAIKTGLKSVLDSFIELHHIVWQAHFDRRFKKECKFS